MTSLTASRANDVVKELDVVALVNIIADIHSISLRDGIITAENILKIVGIWFPQANAIEKTIALTAPIILALAEFNLHAAQPEDTALAYIENKGSNS